MLASARMNSGFIEHLSNFLCENENQAKAIQKLVNAPLDNDNKGEWYRIFDSFDTFHIFPHEAIMNELVQSYGQLYKAKNQSALAEKFVHTILENYAFPDLGNMDALVKVLGMTEENYVHKTQAEKFQIATYITQAYLFYFLAAVFMEFSNRNPNDKDLKPINFEAIQKKLVTAETLKGAANLQAYLKNEEQDYTGFVFAHRCILGLAKEQHGSKEWDHELALCRKLLTMLFNAHPNDHLLEKLQACQGGYQLLGTNHLDAFKALISAHLPENKSAFFGQRR